jgi:hypothetical protein
MPISFKSLNLPAPRGAEQPNADVDPNRLASTRQRPHHGKGA